MHIFTSSALVLALFKVTSAQTPPGTPTVTPLLTANLTFGPALPIGVTPFGTNVVRPINGGQFEGDRLKGTVSFGFADTLLGKGVLYANALYVLTTDDGTNIKVTERAKIPFVELLFEAPDGAYGWLNNVTGWATGSETTERVSLYIWQIQSGSGLVHADKQALTFP